MRDHLLILTMMVIQMIREAFYNIVGDETIKLGTKTVDGFDYTTHDEVSMAQLWLMALATCIHNTIELQT